MVYLLTMLSCIGLNWMFNKVGFYNKKLPVCIIALIVSLPIVLTHGLRYEVGTDYPGYIAYFEAYNYGNANPNSELLFYLVNKTVGAIGLEAQWVLAVFAFILAYLTILQINKDSSIPWLSIFLFFGMRHFFLSMCLVRQFCAGAILFYSIRYIEKKELKKFLFCVLLAFSFHNTSIIFIPIYYLANINLDLKKILGITIILLMVKSSIQPILQPFLELTRYSNYVAEDGYYNRHIFYYFDLFTSLGIFMLAYWKKKTICKDRLYYVYFVISLYCFWFVCLEDSLPYINRLVYYFTLPEINLISLVVTRIKDNISKLIIVSFIIVFYVRFSFVIVFLNNTWHCWPYRSILDFYF